MPAPLTFLAIALVVIGVAFAIDHAIKPSQRDQDASDRYLWIRECAKHRPVEDCRRDYWSMESESKP